jgi:hypothetical protein
MTGFLQVWISAVEKNNCIFADPISSKLPPHALIGGFFVVISKSWKKIYG